MLHLLAQRLYLWLMCFLLNIVHNTDFRYVWQDVYGGPVNCLGMILS